MRACFQHRVSLVTALLAAGCGGLVQAEPGMVTNRSSAKAITQRRVFQEPLVPVGGRPSEGENADLSRALDVYLGKGDARAVAPLTAFLAAHPDSPWRASVLSNLGWVYRQEGYLARAEKAWRQSWDLSKAAQDATERTVADCSAGNLADLLSQAGQGEALKAFLKETRGRVLSGTAGSLLQLSAQQLAAMEKDPAHTLRCGPEALGILATALGRHEKVELLEGKVASEKGTNLAQLQDWGLEIGLDLVGIQLDPQASLPVPALLHWKAGHFATVTKEEGGNYLVRNFLGGDDKWISRDVLAEEAGGYALIPRALAKQQARTAISSRFLSEVWAAGTTSGPDKKGPKPGQPKCPDGKCPKGMATFSFYATQVSLLVEDIPIWYNPPVGPSVAFHVFYNQWDVQQPQTFTYWNLGPKWTNDWLSYVSEDPTNGTSVYLRGGGVDDYKDYDPATGAFAPQYYHHDVLVRTTPDRYERRLPDGSREVFDVPDGTLAPRRIFLTKVIDPSGNTLSFSYDAQRRLVSVTDAMGKVTTVQYELSSDPLKVTKVTDPFGRSASFQYDASNQLKSITDMIGLTSAFSYGPTADAPTVGADFLNTLSTPYGRTTFAAGVSGVDRFLQATDPLGQTERAEYHNYTGSMPYSDAQCPTGFGNQYLYYRNTFYWDKRAMASGAGDWTQAKVYHFMHGVQYPGYTSPLLESTKAALESRVWNAYGQGDYGNLSEGPSSQPTKVARVLDDGTTQSTQASYNAFGKTTQSVDALGRTTSYAYSTDGLDLLEVRNTTGAANELLAQYTYNTQHKPLTVTDAAGQTTTFTYNAAGQIQTLSNPNHETTTFTYNPSAGGYLMNITGAVAGSTTAFTYDGFGRVKTVISSNGNAVSTDYDNLDRPVLVTYQDGTSEAMSYDKLDLVGKKDRLGRWTTMSYNPLQRLSEVQDAAGRVTRFDWCSCGSLEQLTDPMGRITNWWRDLQGRVIGKQLNDTSRTNYGYDSSGRLIQRVDAAGQLTSYQYYPDNNLKQVSYPNALKATPTVSYTYEPAYNRLSSTLDKYGTTTYTYNPVTTPPSLGAGRLATVSGPFPNSTIAYTYDALGRVTGRGINGSGETRTFDPLGRLATVSNPLGAFQYAYQGATGRLDNILLPNGQKTVFSYFDGTQDYRLQGISNQKSDASVISAFNYTYNADGSIKSWSQQADAEMPKVYSFSYDAASQLVGAVLNQGGSTGALIHQYAYGYDLAGNRTSEQIDGSTTAADYNTTNQLTGTRTATADAPVARPVTSSQKAAPVPAKVAPAPRAKKQPPAAPASKKP